MLTLYLKTAPSICQFSDQILLYTKLEILNECWIEASHQNLRSKDYWSKISPSRQPHNKNCIYWKSSWMLFLSLSWEKALKYESCNKYSNKAFTLSSLTDCSHLIAVHLFLKKTFWQKLQLNNFLQYFYYYDIKKIRNNTNYFVF